MLLRERGHPVKLENLLQSRLGEARCSVHTHFNPQLLSGILPAVANPQCGSALSYSRPSRHTPHPRLGRHCRPCVTVAQDRRLSGNLVAHGAEHHRSTPSPRQFKFKFKLIQTQMQITDLRIQGGGWWRTQLERPERPHAPPPLWGSVGGPQSLVAKDRPDAAGLAQVARGREEPWPELEPKG